MARQIFIVDAQIVDANGAFHLMDGYPVVFDSKNYAGDVDKARRRAEGAMADAWSAFCKRDDRQIQTVMMHTADGFQISRKSSGGFPEDPELEE